MLWQTGRVPVPSLGRAVLRACSLWPPSHHRLIDRSAFAQGWEPTKPVQFIIPAGTGGGADQMARFIQGVVAKNNLSKQPIIAVNKAGGAGAEGFLEVKKANGDPHVIIITLSNLFTTPLRDRRALQLEGSDAGRHAGTRPVRPVGPCGHPLQDGEGLYRGCQSRR